MLTDPPYRIELRRASAPGPGRRPWQGTVIVRIDTEHGFESSRLASDYGRTEREARDSALHRARAWVRERDAALGTVGRVYRTPVPVNGVAMSNYRIGIERVTTTGPAEDAAWSADAVVRDDDIAGGVAYRETVEGATEADVRRLAETAAERWIHDRWISDQALRAPSAVVPG